MVFSVIHRFRFLECVNGRSKFQMSNKKCLVFSLLLMVSFVVLIVFISFIGFALLAVCKDFGIELLTIIQEWELIFHLVQSWQFKPPWR